MNPYAPSDRSGRTGHVNELANVLSYLPRLVCDKAGQIDILASDPVLVALLADHAASSALTLSRGIEVIGELLRTHRHAECQGTLTPDAMDALGLLIAETVNLSAALTRLSHRCDQR